jgi:hypothetical protein
MLPVGPNPKQVRSCCPCAMHVCGCSADARMVACTRTSQCHQDLANATHMPVCTPHTRRGGGQCSADHFGQQLQTWGAVRRAVLPAVVHMWLCTSLSFASGCVCHSRPRGRPAQRPRLLFMQGMAHCGHGTKPCRACRAAGGLSMGSSYHAGACAFVYACTQFGLILSVTCRFVAQLL